MKTPGKAAWFQVIGYKPHPKQALYHKSKARFKAPICGRRFGKSVMAGRDEEPNLLIPGRRTWIIGPTYDLGEKEFRVIWNDLIITKKLGQHKKVKKAYNIKQGNMYIEFPWQARLEVRTADRPENLVGESLDHVIMSEAAKHKKETWDRYVRPALADRRGTADFPSTPEGQNWLHDIYLLGQNDDYKDYASWQFPSWENEAIYPGGINDPEIELLRRTMTKEEFDQEIGADFTSFVGKIYAEFNEETHVQNLRFNPSLPNYIAFDFGFTNPLAAVEFQVTPDDQIRIWREHYKSHLTIGEHIAILKSREQPVGYHLDLGFGDAADPAACRQITLELVECIGDPKAKENWRDGIDLVNTFIKSRPSDDVIDEYGTPAEGQPGLIVDANCPNVIREFNNYKGKPGTKVSSPAELPQKIDDHTLDAIRYALMQLYKIGVYEPLGSILDEMDVTTPDIIIPTDREVAAVNNYESEDSLSPLWSVGSGDGEIFGDLDSMMF